MGHVHDEGRRGDRFGRDPHLPAPSPVDTIHDRMPAVIPREGHARWLRPDADVADLLTPTKSNLVAFPVSTYVNSPNNDDPRCIEPAPLMQPSLFG